MNEHEAWETIVSYINFGFVLSDTNAHKLAKLCNKSFSDIKSMYERELMAINGNNRGEYVY